MKVVNWAYDREDEKAREIYDQITSVPPAEVYEKAADEIERRGWIKGAGGWHWWEEDGNAPVCIEGALSAALGVELVVGTGDNVPAQRAFGATPMYHRLCEFIEETRHVSYPMNALFRYNDKHTTKEADVINVLREAAEHEQ